VVVHVLIDRLGAHGFATHRASSKRLKSRPTQRDSCSAVYRRTRVAAVVGTPDPPLVSPAIFNARSPDQNWTGIRGVWTRGPVGHGGGTVVGSAGISVTIAAPSRSAGRPLVSLSDVAARLGAVNSIKAAEDGRRFSGTTVTARGCSTPLGAAAGDHSRGRGGLARGRGCGTGGVVLALVTTPGRSG